MKQRTSSIQQPASNASRNGRPWNIREWISRIHPALLLVFFFPTFLFLMLSTAQAQADVSREYQLKAVFLYNFAQFTEWPDNAFANSNSPIVIGVLGNDPFGPALQETVRGETIQGHPLAIAHYRRAEEIKTCDILFISRSEARRTDEIVRSLKGKPILTVADADAPSSSAAIIRFVVENNKVHFRVNQKAAAEADITLSSKLLRVADATPPENAR